ncbi:MAG TPA: hypothetical protein DCP32_12165 [Anaerolineaceae bacterium]|nr:MAG: hypothetical protein A2X24_07975 [Chloroflexi bacterium GWB2_54_36]HAL17463.1 hypothetical protein [Anaerolineaceae bacterium]HBA92591.1 hypothetical protein [Anaerolineaceae bacterium]
MAQNEIIWPGPIVIERNRWLSLSEPVAALPPGHGANPSAEPIKFVILPTGHSASECPVVQKNPLFESDQGA